jgi:hypothetical protein
MKANITKLPHGTPVPCSLQVYENEMDTAWIKANVIYTWKLIWMIHPHHRYRCVSICQHINKPNKKLRET